MSIWTKKSKKTNNINFFTKSGVSCGVKFGERNCRCVVGPRRSLLVGIRGVIVNCLKRLKSAFITLLQTTFMPPLPPPLPPAVEMLVVTLIALFLSIVNTAYVILK